MTDPVVTHYGGGASLVDAIAEDLRSAGKELAALRTSDLLRFDEIHIQGRKATLELAQQMNLGEDSRVLDIGSGLGGPARTLAEEHGCHVTGIDLTRHFARQLRPCPIGLALADELSFNKPTPLTCHL